MELSVIIPTHNPHPERLRRTLAGLRSQTLPAERWELVVVNNASTQFPGADFFAREAPAHCSIVSEPRLGLSAARRHGFLVARGTVAVLVDDDNVLAPDYLATALDVLARSPRVGVAGGKSLPEFEQAPAPWQREFLPLLALRDLGPAELVSAGLRPAGSAHNTYPAFAPIGAGMVLRREAWSAWLDAKHRTGAAMGDRTGADLSSAGDNEIVLSAIQAGWEAGYFPSLVLTHLIPASRLDAAYLARLNRGIQRSWQQVLARHGASPWTPLGPTGAALRKFKAWFTHQAWSSSAARIRWQGACGHFEGRVQS